MWYKIGNIEFGITSILGRKWKHIAFTKKHELIIVCAIKPDREHLFIEFLESLFSEIK